MQFKITNIFSLVNFFDLAKAFDAVDQHILLKQLNAYSIRRTHFKWFANYFENCSDLISENGTLWSFSGSNLSPPLFPFCVNDLHGELPGLRWSIELVKFNILMLYAIRLTLVFHMFDYFSCLFINVRSTASHLIVLLPR